MDAIHFLDAANNEHIDVSSPPQRGEKKRNDYYTVPTGCGRDITVVSQIVLFVHNLHERLRTLHISKTRQVGANEHNNDERKKESDKQKNSRTDSEEEKKKKKVQPSACSTK